MSRPPGIVLALCAALATACSAAGTEDGGECTDGCDEAADDLKGRADPIAKALLELGVRPATADERKAALPAEEVGTAHAVALDAKPADGFPAGLGAYLTIVRKAAQVNCGNPDAFRTFVISDDLVGSQVFPRVVASLCPQEQDKSPRAFFALSFPDDGGDVDGHEIEMFAWDGTTRRYEFYRTKPLDDSGEGVLIITNPLALDTDNGNCDRCHGGGESTGAPLVPIMNELVEPWSHWNAAPGFASQNFVLPDLGKMPRFVALTMGDDKQVGTGDRIAGADTFERVIREGFALVAKSRRRGFDAKADRDQALSLLRPLFCEEQLSFSSEIATSGVFRLGAIVDEGLRRGFLAKQMPFPWEWVTGTRPEARILPAESARDILELVPMRSEAALSYEEAVLTSLKTLFSPEEILQIRALDWQTPQFSDLRCSLWREVADSMPSITGATNLEAARGLYTQMMTLPVPSGTRPAITAGAGRLLVLDRADPATLAALAGALAAKTVPVVECAAGSTCDMTPCNAGFCEMNLFAFGTRIDAHVQGFKTPDGRARLKQARDARLCRIQQGEFPSAPALPRDFSCN